MKKMKKMRMMNGQLCTKARNKKKYLLRNLEKSERKEKEN